MRPYKRYGWPPQRDLSAAVAGCTVEWGFEGKRHQGVIMAIGEGYVMLDGTVHSEARTAYVDAVHDGEVYTGCFPLSEELCSEMNLTDPVIVSWP